MKNVLFILAFIIIFTSLYLIVADSRWTASINIVFGFILLTVAVFYDSIKGNNKKNNKGKKNDNWKNRRR
mgnify:CR=1 FL=1